jgi:amphi-Trp domain-containing protein
MPDKRKRDVEKVYSTKEFVAKLRRLADALETEQAFEIQIAGERLYIPASVDFSIEHERSNETDEVEFQLRWQRT